jgi:hypothetical protein
MAAFDPKQRELTLRVVLCGPTQAGKSETLARLRERLGDRNVVPSRTLVSQPAVIFAEPTARLVVEAREVDPIEAECDLATCAIAAADGVMFVADSRRERLRDDLVAYAWFLERMREAGRTELPGVLLLNRREASTRVAPVDLEAALGAGRFPAFETEATRGEEISRGVGELLRRAATRIHGELLLGNSGITLPNLLSAVDVAVTREVVVPPPPVEVAKPVEPTRAPTAAPPRSPLLRFGRRMLAEQSRLSRERRRLRDHVAWVEEEVRRPLAFLKSLFLHMEREAPRLSTALDEAVAGASEVLAHLEAILSGARKSAAADASRERSDPNARACDVSMLARQAFAALERELGASRLAFKRGSLPWVDGDPDALRALLWATFSAVARSNRSREGRKLVIRLRVRADGRALRIRVGRLGEIRRSAGLEELVLARRIARRLGLRFALHDRRAGRRDITIDLGAAPAPRRGAGLEAAIS